MPPKPSEASDKAVQLVLDSGFKLDATSAARQAGITDPNKQRTVLKRVKLLKEKAAEMMQSPLQSYTTRLLALNPGLCALGKTTPKPKQKRAQKVPKTGLRIAEQVPRPAIGSRKRSADGQSEQHRSIAMRCWRH